MQFPHWSKDGSHPKHTGLRAGPSADSPLKHLGNYTIEKDTTENEKIKCYKKTEE